MFTLQTGTALHETDDTFAFAAGPGGLFAIKKSQTGTNTTEIHVLSSLTNYQSFAVQTGTALHETDSTFEFLVALNGDVFAIKKSGTGTNTTEVHILSAKDNYQSFMLQTGTALHETDSTFKFLLDDATRDLIAVKKSSTGTNSTELHILLAKQKYQAFKLHTGTKLHETDETFDFAATTNGDICVIKKSNTTSNSTEVQILYAKSDFQDLIQLQATALHTTDNTFAFDATGSPTSFNGVDLWAIKKRNTGTHSTEIHMLSI
jgi:hypothetical protein